MKIKSDFIKRKVADNWLVIATGKQNKDFNTFTELNQTSSDIWDCIELGLTPDEIASRLCEKYDVSLEKAKTDVLKFIDTLKAEGVLIE